MPEDNEIEDNELSKKTFKSKPRIDFAKNIAPNTVYDDELERKKIFKPTIQNDIGRVFYETKLKKEENSQKN